MGVSTRHDLLLYLGWLLVLLTLISGAAVVAFLPGAASLEASKIRFAAATFTGLLVLIVFSAIAYLEDPTGPGKQIFDRVVTATTPIIGAIIGYIFSTVDSPT